MSFPTDTFTGASGDLDVFNPKMWGALINDFAKDARHMASFFTDRSSELAGGGNVIYTPGLTEMAGHSKSNGSQVTLNSPAETSITLTVNTWSEVSFAIEDGDLAKVKKSYYIVERYASNAGYTAANILEDAIIALFTSFTQTAGASTTVLLDSDIRKAIGIVESTVKKPVDNGEFYLFLDTKVFWNQIAGITTYQLNINSPVSDPVSKRPMPLLYGIPVKLSNRIAYVSGSTGRVNVLAHKDAIHYATSPLPGQGADLIRTQRNYIPDYLSNLVTADLQFGVVMNRPTYGCILYSSAS